LKAQKLPYKEVAKPSTQLCKDVFQNQLGTHEACWFKSCMCSFICLCVRTHYVYRM